MAQEKQKTFELPFVTLANNKQAVILEYKKNPNSSHLLVLPLDNKAKKIDNETGEDETDGRQTNFSLPKIPSIKTIMDPSKAGQHFNAAFREYMPKINPHTTLLHKVMQVFYNSKQQFFEQKKDIATFITSLTQSDTIHILNINPMDELIKSSHEIKKHPNILALINIATKYSQCITDMQRISHDYLSSQKHFEVDIFRWILLNAETTHAVEETVRKIFLRILNETASDPFQTLFIKELVADIRDIFDTTPILKATETMKEIGNLVKNFPGLMSQQDKAENPYEEISTSKAVIQRMYAHHNYDYKLIKLTQFILNLESFKSEKPNEKNGINENSAADDAANDTINDAAAVANVTGNVIHNDAANDTTNDTAIVTNNAANDATLIANDDAVNSIVGDTANIAKNVAQ